MLARTLFSRLAALSLYPSRIEQRSKLADACLCFFDGSNVKLKPTKPYRAIIAAIPGSTLQAAVVRQEPRLGRVPRTRCRASASGIQSTASTLFTYSFLISTTLD